MHVPPFQLFVRSLESGNGDPEPPRMVVARAVIRFLIRETLAREPFDEERYLASNPDVATAIRRGDVSSGQDHYATDGYFEGRGGAGPVFDEAWYLRRYPDVALGVKSGQWQSGWQHYQNEGMFEWRSPSAADESDLARWQLLLTPRATKPEAARAGERS